MKYPLHKLAGLKYEYFFLSDWTGLETKNSNELRDNEIWKFIFKKGHGFQIENLKNKNNRIAMWKKDDSKLVVGVHVGDVLKSEVFYKFTQKYNF